MPSSVLDRAGLFARTMAHLHPVQVLFRPVHMARTQVLSRFHAVAARVAGHQKARWANPLIGLTGSLPQELPGVALELERARHALAGELEFVGTRLRIAPPHTDFLAKETPKLVRYQLNYLGIAR